ncbi:copper amine oxidase N-terminal domain-containing protein [Paenibacillus sp. D2_2]|uniref:copper amine oxidase N-terminal domain-containing protein n=1 Tax=Paenibacillus sp. D2_2 TaxID=3073092 RepID=UPI0028161D0F|nr:copper amine oxidase N-terminal domain-containing protein [Paenibacillus sp. D2_2]WMT41956.1 copper amine oxidase N-terminal domain-containing protein [Paenibacillus sp. D2_2]
MKKYTYLTLMGCLAVLIGLFSFTTPTSAAAAVSYTLYIDGKVSSAKTPVVVEKNVTLIPMKAVLTDLKYVTSVDKKTKAITAKNSAGSFITVNLGSKNAKINGANANLAAPAKTLNGTTYIPLSAVKQLTGKAIGLDASKGIAWIGEKPTENGIIPIWGGSPAQIKKELSDKVLIDEGGRVIFICCCTKIPPKTLKSYTCSIRIN